MRLAFRVLAAALVIASLVSSERSAQSAMMESTDLTSLALESDAIIRAKKIGERRIDEWNVRTIVRAEETYGGAINPGDSFEVSLGAFSMTPMMGWPDGGATISDDVILFLGADTNRRAVDAGAPSWRVTMDGLRIFVDGHVYRFLQLNNPGLYEPVPQGHDPFDIFGDPRGGAILDIPSFVQEIAIARARAASIRTALAAPASPARTKALLDFLGPPPSATDADDVVSLRSGGFYENRAAERIVDALATTHDLHGYLTARTRARGLSWSAMGPARFTTNELLAATHNASFSSAERAVALRMIGEDPFSEGPTDDVTRAKLVALLDDPDPEIRGAALGERFPRDKVPPGFVKALKHRWTVETDPNLRVGIFQRARDLDVLNDLQFAPGSLPIAAGRHHGRQISIAWEDFDSEQPWNVSSLSVLARNAGGASSDPWISVPTFGGDAGVGEGTSYSTADLETLLPRDPRLTPGSWDLRATFVLERKNTQVTREVALGTIVLTNISSSTASTGDPLDASVDAALDAAITHDGAAAPSPVTPRRSCGCAVIGASDEFAGCGSASLFALAAVSIVARRRERRAAHFETMATRLAEVSTDAPAPENAGPTDESPRSSRAKNAVA